MTQCAAKSKRTGEQCQQPAMHGAKVCYHHGGKSPRGVASPAFKDGTHSAYMPKRILDRYNAAERDPELLNGRSDIALAIARLSDLLGRVDSGESGKAWSEARKMYDDLRYYMTKKDAGGIQGALTGLDRVIGAGLADYAAWAEIHTLLTQIQRLRESERRRLVEMSQMVTTEDALTLVGAVLASVKRNVTDRGALVAIQADMARLMNVGEGK